MANERPTRMTILCLLKKNGKMTAKQVGEALGVTSMGARQHLTAMEKEGVLDSEFVRQKAGRPALYFKLTPRSDKFFPQQYNDLIINLLRTMEEMDGRDKIGQLLDQRRKKLKTQYESRMNGGGTDERIQTLSQLRDQEGYMTNLSDRDGSFEFVEHNCPISRVAHEYPEICQQELALFRELIGLQVERVDHMIDGGHACVYKFVKGNGNGGCVHK
ncbi:MAG: winged helix-turn-helix transcriptional regulator [bacterium]|nr:winged helix-turn-helix transcriptional regulator [bacterium]